MFFTALCGSSTDSSFFSLFFLYVVENVQGISTLSQLILHFQMKMKSNTTHSYSPPCMDLIKSIWIKLSFPVKSKPVQEVNIYFHTRALIPLSKLQFPIFFMLAFIIAHIRRSLFSVSQYMTDYTACLCFVSVVCNRICFMSSVVMNYYFGLRTKHFYRVCMIRIENNPKKISQVPDRLNVLLGPDFLI